MEYSGLEIFVIVRSMPKKSALCGLFVSKQINLTYGTGKRYYIKEKDKHG